MGISRARRRCLVLTAGLLAASAAVAQQPALPYLYIAWLDADGRRVPGTAQPVIARNYERMRLEVCLRSRSVADAFEMLQIRAVNQHPDYFRQRPGPNVTMMVTRVEGSRRTEVPFRISSSGGGKSLTLHYVSTDIDVLEDLGERNRKARAFLDWMAEEAKKQGIASQALGIVQNNPQQMQAMVEQIADQYVNNPPGDYEVTARYQPVSRGDHWMGTLVAAPFRVRVTAGPDAFDLLKQKASSPRPQLDVK